jgi:hypothetical protein
MPNTTRTLHIVVLVAADGAASMVESVLDRARQQHRVPDEIHVIGARDDLARVYRGLLRSTAGGNRFAKECGRLGIPRDEILFNQRTLHPMELESQDLSAAAERLFQVFRHLSRGGRNELTVLVARDATALGVLAHAAMQLVARPLDRFFVELAPKSGRKAQAERLRSAEVPLLLWPDDGQPVAHYVDAVNARRMERQRLEQPDPLRLDAHRRVATVGGTTIRLPAMQFFWLYYLAASAGERFPLLEISTALAAPKRHGTVLTQKLAGGHVRSFPADLQRAFVRLFPQGADKFEAMFLRACGPQPGLPSTISKINAALRRALGRGAAPYLIEGGRGAGGYRVTLPPASIHVVER